MTENGGFNTLCLTMRKLPIYTIYKHPSDYPGLWVMRVHVVPGGPRPVAVTAKSLEAIRAHVPGGLIRTPRQPNDDPVIYETWM